MITRAEEKDVDVFEEDAQLHIKGINIDWDKISRGSYLRDIPSISGVSSLMFHKPITFFVGENGSGKSTLLEAIAVAYGFNPEGGTKNYSFSTYVGYYKENEMYPGDNPPVSIILIKCWYTAL